MPVAPIPAPPTPPEDWVVKPVNKPIKPVLKRIRVTGQAIFDITQRFERVFTLKDVVMAFSVIERIEDETEIQRVRSAIYNMMRSLAAQRKIVQVDQAFGKRPGTWKRVTSNVAFVAPKDINVIGVTPITNGIDHESQRNH